MPPLATNRIAWLRRRPRPDMLRLFRPASTRFVLIAVACALAIVAMVTSLLTITKLRSRLVRVQLVNEKRFELENAFSAMRDAETAQRGFLITGDNRYLTPLEVATQEISNIFARLYSFAPDDPTTRDQISELRLLIDRKLAELQSTITVRRREGRDAAQSLVANDEGRKIMEQIRERFQGMLSEAREEVRVLRGGYFNALFYGEVAGLGAGLLALICGLGSLWMYREALVRVEREEKLAQGKLKAEEASREKSAFLATMSHEIRTPMNAILGFGELLHAEVKEERLRGFTDSILSSGRALLQLINDILDLSKVEAGKLDLHIGPTDVRGVALFVERLFAQQAREKQLDWKVEIADGIPSTLLLDELRVRQVLLNLIANAFKFTEAGSVKLSVRPGPGSAENSSRIPLVLEVSDTGMGIPPERVQKIFEPFEQAGADARSQSGGTGLGLAIVKQLVELMGGTIAVRSSLGGGTTIRVVFAEVEVSARLARSVLLDDSDDVIDFNGLRAANVLVVDDNATNRQLVRAMLADSHHTVEEASDGKVALEKIFSLKPDLVLMDIRMPGMNGPEVLDAVRAKAGFELLPVVAVTASSMLAGEGELRRAFSGYLRKPFSRAELFGELAAFLPRLENVPIDPTAPGDTTVKRGPVSIAVGTQLHSLLIRDYPRVRDGLATSDVREFADAISAVAEQAKSRRLREYAQNLRQASESFSVGRLESALEDFPAIVERLAPTLTAPPAV